MRPGVFSFLTVSSNTNHCDQVARNSFMSPGLTNGRNVAESTSNLLELEIGAVFVKP